MSGGPPHHPHGRQQPSSTPAWNHLQVPNYFPSRQLQHAHMSNEHPILHQPTWHTPTTEPVKTIPHSHLFNLEQMISERSFQRHTPGVDLSLQRNGNQNGELPTSPISLSVRDTNKINSLPAGAIDIQAVELTKSLSPSLKTKSAGSPGIQHLKSTSPTQKCASPGAKTASPGLKSASPGIKTSSPSLKIAPTNLLSSGAHGLLPSNIGVVCTSSGLMMTTSFGGMSSSIMGSTPQLPNLTITPSFFPTFKATGPLSPGQQSSPKNSKRPTKRVDSIIERLTPNVEKCSFLNDKGSCLDIEKAPSVIVQANATSNNNDENSNSSSVVIRDDDVVSPFSANEDSTDSSKSRRKRKPSKTIKVTKEEEKMNSEPNNFRDREIKSKKDEVEEQVNKQKNDTDKEQERRRSGSAPPGSPSSITKTRRKTSSESETIANIAAMVKQTISADNNGVKAEKKCEIEKDIKSESESQKTETNKTDQSVVSVSVIRDSKHENRNEELETKETKPNVSAQKSFVEVENKLQEMFAGITDETDSSNKIIDFSAVADNSKTMEIVEGENNGPSTSQSSETVTSTSNGVSFISGKNCSKSKKRKTISDQIKTPEMLSMESSTPKKKKSSKKSKNVLKKETITTLTPNKPNKKPSPGKSLLSKQENLKDIYAYDSGSNASSGKSRGPFIQIRGPRDSPLSINIINAPTSEEDLEKKSLKGKKYHDDNEYRHKIQSRGLHSSTLSNKYDAQTRDASWICAFCKRGPHATDPTLPGPSPFHISNVDVPPPGDLFGPYIINLNPSQYDRRMDDPFDKQFRSKKVARAVDTATASTSKAANKKSKRKHVVDSNEIVADNNSFILGLTETKDKNYEVWMHEDCVVWSSGVYLIGSKVVGLEEAVWTSCNTTCARCNYKGANVSCVKRGCASTMHIGCARMSNWKLNEFIYKATCTNHAAMQS